MPHSLKRCLEIEKLVEQVGRAEAAKQLKLTPPTIRMALTTAKRSKESGKVDKGFNPTSTLKRIQELYSEKELTAISMGGRILPGIENVPIISFGGKHIRIGVIGDTHIGHQKFSEDRLFQAFEEFKKEKVDFIVHTGDVTEGLSHRAGHVFELSHIGYEQQKDYAIKLFSQWNDTDIYAIDGNHDRWYIKSNGAFIVKDIERALPNFKFLGHDEGDISLDGRATLKLWHGEDGNSYALSYRVQKIIESLTGGEKPDILLCGHTHKYVKVFERNITAISAGCIEGQTSWMRGKRIAAHVGFIVLDVWIGDKGVSKVQDCWFPFYC